MVACESDLPAVALRGDVPWAQAIPPEEIKQDGQHGRDSFHVIPLRSASDAELLVGIRLATPVRISGILPNMPVATGALQGGKAR